MAHSYTPEYPSNTAINPQIVQFFEDFYRITDTNTPEAHEQYVNNFTKDAVFIMASKTVRGHEEIMAARKGMWTNVARRLHTPIRIFPFGTRSGSGGGSGGAEGQEMMLYGTVAYELWDGRKRVVEWAARARLVREEKEGEGEWKFGFYQVYLDPTAWQNAK